MNVSVKERVQSFHLKLVALSCLCVCVLGWRAEIQASVSGMLNSFTVEKTGGKSVVGSLGF